MAEEMNQDAASATNGYDGDAANEFLQRAEAEQAQIDEFMAEATKKCEIHRTAIKTIKKEAKKALAVNASIFDAALRYRRLGLKQAAIPTKLGDDLQDEYTIFMEAVGEFADTPLGEAATPDQTAGEGSEAVH